jgi:predicted Zn-dependent peptidase
VTQEELNRAKLSVKTDWSFAFEKPSDIAYVYGYWNLMKRPEAVKECVEKTEKLTAKDIQNFFEKYYSRDKLVSSALVPKADKHKADK